jgi:hypothetical protein
LLSWPEKEKWRTMAVYGDALQAIDADLEVGLVSTWLVKKLALTISLVLMA